jgi:hypothetical protein
MPPTSAVLILTPMKDASRHLRSYFAGLERLSYPKQLVSLGFLEGDSIDDTAEAVESRLLELRARFASANLWRKDFGFRLPPGIPRWEHAFQLARRKILARARNHLLFHALEDQEWVLWMDVDVVDYPQDLVEQLIAAGRDIVHPHCVRVPGGDTFDLNAWSERGALRMQDMRGGPDLVRLDAVGGTALLVRADVHRDGLIFPPFPYGAPNSAVRSPHPLGPTVRGEIETEGLGIMAQDMGYQCWGMPNLEIVHAAT